MINPRGGPIPGAPYVRRSIAEQCATAADAMWRELMTDPEDWHPGWRLVGLASIASDLSVPGCWSTLDNAVSWAVIERQDQAICRRHADCPLVRDGSRYRIAPGASPGRARAALHG